MLTLAIRDLYPGQIALVSSFGTEAALLLAMVADVDPATPVLFLETGKHFPETLEYRDTLIDWLGLTGVRNITPDPIALAAQDPDGMLWKATPNACCAIRKVVPLQAALEPFSAWINGRKRYQGSTRERLGKLEWDAGKVKVNPLADWSLDDVIDAFKKRNLPRHPLQQYGYLSVGCAPCTLPSDDPNDPRAGRWAGLEKVECGIHVSAETKV